MGLKEEFEEYAEKAQTLPENTSNENKLNLYGLYKQATVGNVNTSRPGILNMRDRAKWDAWKAVEGGSFDLARMGTIHVSLQPSTCSDMTFTRDVRSIQLDGCKSKLGCAHIGKSKEEAMSDYITKVKQLL